MYLNLQGFVHERKHLGTFRKINNNTKINSKENTMYINLDREGDR